MAKPDIVIETLREPGEYSQAQIDEMCHVWAMLGDNHVLKVMTEPEPDPDRAEGRGT